MQGDEKHGNQAQQGHCPSERIRDPQLSTTPGQTIFKNRIFLPAGLQYAHRGRKLITGPNLKAILSPARCPHDTVVSPFSCTRARLPGSAPSPGAAGEGGQSTGTVTERRVPLRRLAARSDFTEDAPSVTVLCSRA